MSFEEVSPFTFSREKELAYAIAFLSVSTVYDCESARVQINKARVNSNLNRDFMCSKSSDEIEAEKLIMLVKRC